MSDAVYVVYGGMSVERPVSLRSGKAVIDALHEAGYDVQAIDMTSLKDIESIPDKAVVLPILHGKYGEDGIVQKILESKNIKFLGSGSTASSHCFDKELALQKFSENKLDIPNGVTVKNYNEYQASLISDSAHVLKVAKGGSSIGTMLVRNGQTVSKEDVNNIFKNGDKAILEEIIEGVEITVPVLGNKALPVIEIVPPQNGEFDYANKYNGKSKEICPAISISTSIQLKAQKIAEKTHSIMKCRHLSRSDMIVNNDGEIKLLEINTMPGMTKQSLYPIGAMTAGYTMPQLAEEFVKITKEG